MSEGGRSPRVADEDILELFRESDDPVLSTVEVADELPIDRRGVLDRLHQLTETEQLDSKKIGDRNIVWWLIGERDERDPSDEIGGSPETTLDREDETLDRRGTPTLDQGLPEEKVRKETGITEDSTSTVSDPDQPSEDTTDLEYTALKANKNLRSVVYNNLAGRDDTGNDEELVEAVRTYLETNDIPPETDHGRDLIIDTHQYLREHERAKTGEIREALAPDHADRYSDEADMWNSVCQYVEHIPWIEKTGENEWVYTSDQDVRETVNKQ